MGGQKTYPTRIRLGINFNDAGNSSAEISVAQVDAVAQIGLLAGGKSSLVGEWLRRRDLTGRCRHTLDPQERLGVTLTSQVLGLLERAGAWKSRVLDFRARTEAAIDETPFSNAINGKSVHRTNAGQGSDLSQVHSKKSC